MVGWIMARRSEGGFTLLEVLIAVTILAIALGAIISSVGRAADNVGYMRDKTFSHWVAMNVLAEAQAKGAWPATGSSDGKEEMANHEWHWKMIVADNSLSESLREVTVEVRRDAKDKQALATLASMLRKP